MAEMHTEYREITKEEAERWLLLSCTPEISVSSHENDQSRPAMPISLEVGQLMCPKCRDWVYQCKCYGTGFCSPNTVPVLWYDEELGYCVER